MNRLSENRPLRFALIGCGRVAQRVHAPLLARLPGSVLSAVVDPSADAKVIARRLNPHVALHATVDDLLANGGFDAACICLPTHMHASCGVRFLEAGYPIYLEKPIATSARDTSALLGAWRSSGQVAMIGYNYRFHPVHRRLKELLDARAVGRMTAIRTVFSTPARALPGWKRSQASGGGVLLDLLSHHADLVAFHTGERATAVSALTRSVHSEQDNAQVTWTLESGVSVQSTVSMTGAEQDRFEVIGEDGAIHVDRFRRSVTVVPRSHSATTPEMCARSIGLAMTSMRALRPTLDPSFRLALKAFIDGVREGRSPAPDLRDGWNSLSLVLSATRSASQDGLLVRVESEPDDASDAIREEECPPVRSGGPAFHEAIEQTPDLSVVLVTITGMTSLRKVMSRLRLQSNAHRIQVLIVAPDATTLDDLCESDRAGFYEVVPVLAGPIDDVDKASALALDHATAPFLTFLEDHAFPTEGWAEGVIEACRSGPWDAVGTGIENGNPGSVLSWANMLMSYGSWVAVEHAGSTTNVARHNTTFRRSTLVREYGRGLPEMMGRDGGLLADLLGRGAVYYLQPASRVEHLNPSTWRSTLQLRIGSGRLFAASRMKREKWSKPKRAMYILCGVAIPFIRFRILRDELLSSELRRARIGVKAYPALILGVLLDGFGQFLGHTIGPGQVKQDLAFFEISRARHLRWSERDLMTESGT